MRIVLLKSLFTSNALLKSVSLILGYTFWYITSAHHIITKTATVPLCFTPSDQYTISAPEVVDVTIKGTRSQLYHINEQSLAAHIDVSHLFPGKHGILISAHHFFLPSTISVELYKPLNLVITLTKI